ncbi:MAG: serine acetyltransferase [Desulfobacteraceae bacterium]|nr:serine acetyltransferase [Desulfobacteraceae bacterium]
MVKNTLELDKACRTDAEVSAGIRARLPEIAEQIIKDCIDTDAFSHVEYEPLTTEGYVSEIIDKFREILFPGYYEKEKLDPANLKYGMGQSVSQLYDLLSENITHHIRHDCFKYHQSCKDCEELGQKIALDVLSSVPALRRILATDVQAAFDGDPAAKGYDEIIFCYPGIYAITVYRVAHEISKHGVPMLPRIMTEHAHRETGIDIHPGAQIGERFAIDHGTGIVIGETTEIGRNVRVYQGVTLGALSLPKDAGKKLRGKKRHPTIEDDVIIYSGATILGGQTIIGARSVIGGNVWITGSVPADTTVLLENPKLVYKSNRSKIAIQEAG